MAAELYYLYDPICRISETPATFKLLLISLESSRAMIGIHPTIAFSAVPEWGVLGGCYHGHLGTPPAVSISTA